MSSSRPFFSEEKRLETPDLQTADISLNKQDTVRIVKLKSAALGSLYTLKKMLTPQLYFRVYCIIFKLYCIICTLPVLTSEKTWLGMSPVT